MIELTITIAILSFGIIGVYGAFSPMVRLNATIVSKFTASQLAQEGFELARNMRSNKALLQCALGCRLDYRAGTLAAYDDSEYLNITADGFYGYEPGAATKFKRKITVTQAGSPDILKITAAVMWNDNGKSQTFETIGYLYNYQ